MIQPLASFKQKGKHGEWLPDGNQDGIPDDRQQSNRDDIQSSGPGDSGNPEGGGGAAGGDCQIL